MTKAANLVVVRVIYSVARTVVCFAAENRKIEFEVAGAASEVS